MRPEIFLWRSIRLCSGERKRGISQNRTLAKESFHLISRSPCNVLCEGYAKLLAGLVQHWVEVTSL